MEQIGSALLGSRSALLLAPVRNPLMVAREQHVRHQPAPVIRRSCVVRLLEKTRAEALQRNRLGVADNVGQQAGHSLDYRKGADFSTKQYIITKGYLVIDEVVSYPLIHTFISTADEGEMLAACPFVEKVLGQGLAGRRQQNPVSRGQRCQCRSQWFDHHDHAGPATERSVVELSMNAFPEVPQVNDLNAQQSIVEGAANETNPKWGIEKLREHSDYGDLHGYRVF